MLAPLYKPFYSKNFYRTDAVQGRGIGFWLLAFIALLFMALSFYMAKEPVAQFFQTDLPPILSKMPTMTFENGRLSIDKPMPYSVPLDLGDGVTSQVLFEDKKFESPDSIRNYMLENNIIALAIPTDLIVLSERGELKMFSFAEAQKREVLTPENLHEISAKVQRWFWPVMVIAGTVFLTIALLVLTLVISLFGLMLNAMFGTRLSYGAVMRFCSYAVWGASVVCAVLIAAAVQGTTLFFWLAIIAFLLFAFISVRTGMAKG